MSGSVRCRHCANPVVPPTAYKSVCIDCQRKSARERMARWIARNPDEHRRRSKENHRPMSPEKRNVRQRVYQAIKRGKLTKGVCEVCGETKVDAHHEDYSKPLEVRWLCRKHHLELHRKVGHQ